MQPFSDRPARLKPMAGALAIAWVLAHPAVTVCLCGAKSPAQVDDHLRAAAWRLTAADRAELASLLEA